jgi:hypothetical protein
MHLTVRCAARRWTGALGHSMNELPDQSPWVPKGHADESVGQLAAETVKEIDIFRRSEESYGYVFYVLRRA